MPELEDIRTFDMDDIRALIARLAAEVELPVYLVDTIFGLSDHDLQAFFTKEEALEAFHSEVDQLRRKGVHIDDDGMGFATDWNKWEVRLMQA